MHKRNLSTHPSRRPDRKRSVSYRYRSRSHPFSRLQRPLASPRRHTTVRPPSTGRPAPTVAAAYSLPYRLASLHRTVDLQHRRPCLPIPTISSTKATTTSATRRHRPPSSRTRCTSTISTMRLRKRHPCIIIPCTLSHRTISSISSSSACNSTTIRPTCVSCRSR